MPKKEAKPKLPQDPDAPARIERSSRKLTEIYAWTAGIYVQGTDLRYLEFVGTDGKEAFRVMNIDPSTARQLAGMLVPEPAE